MKEYSFLMSVYKKEHPEFLEQSIESMLVQTIIPDQIVIVKDGPLTNELDEVINKFDAKFPELFNIVVLEKNMGLGKALNEGLKACRNELVARMDSDDLCKNNRCELQLQKFQENADLSIVGTAVDEFDLDINKINATKTALETDNEIKKYMRSRNPMNHPTVMFKKSDVEKVGGYQDMHFNEDYYLWVRMALANMLFANINESLVLMRVTIDTYGRRGGYKYYKTQKKLNKFMLKNKMISHFEYHKNNLIKFIIRVLMPKKLRKHLYIRALRNN